MSFRNDNSNQSEATSTNDYAAFQNTAIRNGMLKYGFTTTQNILDEQKARLLPGVSDFFSNLKIYFAVSNTYVLKKLSIVLVPMRNQIWARISADEAARDGDKVHQLIRSD